ncbi:MAG: A/G-specific adenine glycosylase [Planctomycetota bacterium]
MAADPRTGRVVRALCAWFADHRRDLPWRQTGPGGTRDPYHALVAETMLQQTQVARVIEKFEAFIAAFPTIAGLAEADEDRVLALWSGLGYYRRARNLHRAARDAVDRFGGLPESADELRSLPGVGRYTAGAIASIVHGRPEPIVDGNVTRVLLRLENRDLEPASSAAQRWCWGRAEQVVLAADRSRARGVGPAAVNEAMMELGATVCTPRNPSCDRCPVRTECRAFAAGSQHRIPRPKRAAAKKDLLVACLRVQDAQGRWLIEQRPKSGLWAGLWQPPAVESAEPIGREQLAERLASRVGIAASGLIAQDTFLWETSHRSVRFEVFVCNDPILAPSTGPTPKDTVRPGRRPRAWAARDELDSYATGSAQRRALFGAAAGTPALR